MSIAWFQNVAKRVGPSIVVLVVAALIAPAAYAQTGSHFALGIDFTKRSPARGDGQGAQNISMTWRILGAREGWGWSYGFNWFDTDIGRKIAGRDIAFGGLTVRPLMAGYGYTWVLGRASLTADVLGGYAFTSFNLTPAADDLYRDGLGARSVHATAANTFVAKPELEVWFDVSPKVGIVMTGGYVIARPRITVTSTLGQDVQRYRADMLIMRVGAVYSIF